MYVLGVEWMRELGFDFTNPVGTWEVLDMCLLRLGVGRGLDQGLDGWCVSLDSLCRWQVQVSVYCAPPFKLRSLLNSLT